MAGEVKSSYTTDAQFMYEKFGLEESELRALVAEKIREEKVAQKYLSCLKENADLKSASSKKAQLEKRRKEAIAAGRMRLIHST